MDTAPTATRHNPRVRVARRLFAALFATLSCGIAEGAGEVAIQLAWDRNPESHVVGYRLSCGTRPGTYDRSHEVGNQTSASIEGLAVDSTYYFTVVAIAEDGSLSAPSPEISYRTPSAFAAWMKSAGAVGDGAADADADGLANAVEYLTGGNPARADGVSAGLACSVALQPGGRSELVLRYRRATDAAADPRLEHDVQLSLDGLRTWTDASRLSGIAETRTSDPQRPDLERVEVRVPIDDPRRPLFGRLRVALLALP